MPWRKPTGWDADVKYSNNNDETNENKNNITLISYDSAVSPYHCFLSQDFSLVCGAQTCIIPVKYHFRFLLFTNFPAAVRLFLLGIWFVISENFPLPRNWGGWAENWFDCSEMFCMILKWSDCWSKTKFVFAGRQKQRVHASAGFPARMCTLCFITFFALFSAHLKFRWNF